MYFLKIVESLPDGM